MKDFALKLSEEFNISLKNIEAVILLLEGGNTIPFIARYRKEATGNLDEVAIRVIQERFGYLKELDERKTVILESIKSQNKLTDELKQKIEVCEIKAELEDLYLPFKPKRRTKASIAREKDLEPLACRLLEQPISVCLEDEVKPFIQEEKGVLTLEDALSGARDIAAEMVAENATVRKLVRELFKEEGMVVSTSLEEKPKEATKFEQYYNFKEAVKTIPSHRYLAIRRGEKEDVLKLSIEIEADSVIPKINALYKLNPASPFKNQLEKAILDSYKRLILPSVETDFRIELKMQSDRAAVDVFADNLKNLLLAAPLGRQVVIGIDPGLRTGCKCAVVDDTGKYLDTVTLYLCQGERAVLQAEADLIKLIEKYHPFAIAIGNGTAGRETEKMVKSLLVKMHLKGIIVIPVSEAGASVYSASDIAREEFPDLDLTIRGAVSIARRLQDPLAELVKVDPKAIGVGQYQHDVHQPLLHDKLKEVVESSVNHVGVELNTASASLLSYVAGINASLAKKIVKHREVHGAFKSRFELMEVSGLGAKAFEQAAGFLRVKGSKNPLDASSVHPERYKLVEQMAADLNVSLEELIANDVAICTIDLKKYEAEEIGKLTLQDIVAELKKPGRDPRKTFEAPAFREDVLTVKDLKTGMKLEGIVTNVAAFGVFVDIGVHQDGFIHISELSHRFIKDPKEVAKVGDKIQVEVLQIDEARNRISLTAKIGSKKPEAKEKPVKKPGFTSPFANL
ncbi:MAG TPA: Tex family protein [Parachlamydiaceae bacterium]|nr:Tex family protein [Parachlamydiaceae bacterium]